MAFNIMDIMNQASKNEAGIPKYELQKLDIAKLYPDPTNQAVYSVENIEELADAIEVAGGVLHNLVVRSADKDGKYMIISGERRWRACNLLVHERSLQQYHEVSCLVENEHDSDMLDLMLILTNSTARQLSDAEKARQAEHMTDILNRIKEQSGLEGRVRSIVGRMLQMSSSQLARYHAISKNLQNEELKQAFKSGQLKVSAAYEASQLSDEGQQKIADKLQEEGTVSLSHVTAVKNDEREDLPAYKEETAPFQDSKNSSAATRAVPMTDTHDTEPEKVNVSESDTNKSKIITRIKALSVIKESHENYYELMRLGSGGKFSQEVRQEIIKELKKEIADLDARIYFFKSQI